MSFWRQTYIQYLMRPRLPHCEWSGTFQEYLFTRVLISLSQSYKGDCWSPHANSQCTANSQLFATDTSEAQKLPWFLHGPIEKRKSVVKDHWVRPLSKKPVASQVTRDEMLKRCEETSRLLWWGQRHCSCLATLSIDSLSVMEFYCLSPNNVVLIIPNNEYNPAL